MAALMGWRGFIFFRGLFFGFVSLGEGGRNIGNNEEHRECPIQIYTFENEKTKK